MFFALILCMNVFSQQTQLTEKEKAKLYPAKAVVSRYHNDWTIKHYRERIKVFMKDPL